MYVNLKDIVKNLAQKKTLEWSGTREDRVWNIDNNFSKKGISVDGAMEALKKEFRYEFSEYDYREIKKQLGGK